MAMPRHPERAATTGRLSYPDTLACREELPPHARDSSRSRFFLTLQAEHAYKWVMNTESVLEMLRKACAEHGSIRAWARENKLSPMYVSDVLRGKRDPGPGLCAALGLERQLVVERKATYRKARA